MGVERYVFNVYLSAYSGRIQSADRKVGRMPERIWREVKSSSKTVGGQLNRFQISDFTFQISPFKFHISNFTFQI